MANVTNKQENANAELNLVVMIAVNLLEQTMYYAQTIVREMGNVIFIKEYAHAKKVLLVKIAL